MEAELQSHVAFHLTGRRPGTTLDAVEQLDLRPALLARYRDLTKLRYDFPIVLCDDARGADGVRALSEVVDRVLAKVVQGDDAERVTKQVLQCEQQIRVLGAEVATGKLSVMWDAAATRLTAADPSVSDSLSRARASLDVEGDVVDCDGGLPAHLVTHAFRAAQAAKARRFHDTVERLKLQLSNLLRVDFVRSEAGRSAPSLKASMGSLHGDVFDFDAMSDLLNRASRGGGMSTARRQRLEWLLAMLESQRFYAPPGAKGAEAMPHRFEFESCTAALAAYRDRLPEVTQLAKALAIAELEAAGEYNEARHDAFFEAFGEVGLHPADLALFPDYLVVLNALSLDAVENATLTQILSAGLPMKVLVRSDDVLDELALGERHIGFGRLSRPVTTMAMGLNEVFVLQAPASHLYRFRERIARGLAFGGPALFRVFSGANGKCGDMPAYLVAAAAMQSRAFPAWSYDPSAGADWAARFDLADNPQPDADWPVARLDYEDASHQAVHQDLTFTLVDFAACDRRYARHFARVPREQWNAKMVPASECLANDDTIGNGQLPYILMADRDGVLSRVLVDERLMREARRARDMWHSLQELAGINNSHAERLLAREREAIHEGARRAAAAEAEAPPAPAPSAAPAAAPAPAAEAAPEPSSDDAYIETARCTSCNECTNINDKMFAYNENKQAYIKNPDAGTYAQLVEAAEGCQVSIIHPGKPRNPDEPGLGDLLERAAPFA